MSSPFALARSAAAAALLVACNDGGTPLEPYDLPTLAAADFVRAVDNPFFPLVPGTRYSYSGRGEDGPETSTVEVLRETRQILGITATVVLDREFLNGQLVEETRDWYAQDRDGDVWYLGEDSREIRNGRVVSTDGSWEAGIDGARPGIIMWGDPAVRIGQEYFQEYYAGEAVDKGKVLAVGETVQVPAGRFTGCVRTEDWDLLEPGVRENKFYCPGVGLVREVTVRGGSEHLDLQSITRP